MAPCTHERKPADFATLGFYANGSDRVRLWLVLEVRGTPFLLVIVGTVRNTFFFLLKFQVLYCSGKESAVTPTSAVTAAIYLLVQQKPWLNELGQEQMRNSNTVSKYIIYTAVSSVAVTPLKQVQPTAAAHE